MFISPEHWSAHRTEGVSVWFDRVPREHISEVLINPFVAEITQPDFQHRFLQENTIMDMTTMSVTTGIGELNVMTAPSYGRAVPLGFVDVPTDRAMYTLLRAKGCSISGARYTMAPRDLLYGHLSADPHGLFGYVDADWETRISNDLYREGFRTAIPYATVIYKESVRQWVLSRIDDPKTRQLIDISFQLVRANHDVPVQQFQLHGTVERYNTFQQNLFSHALQYEDIRRGATMMLQEYAHPHVYSPLIHTYLSYMDESNRSHVLNGFAAISRGESIGIHEYRAYKQFLAALYATNHFALVRVIESRNKRKESENIIPYTVSDPTNVCCGHFTSDYELSRGAVSTTDLSLYDELVAKGMQTFLIDTDTRLGFQDRFQAAALLNPRGSLLSFLKPNDRIDAFFETTEGEIAKAFSQMLGRAHSTTNR